MLHTNIQKMVRNIKVTYSDEDFKLMEEKKKNSKKNWEDFIFDCVLPEIKVTKIEVVQ